MNSGQRRKFIREYLRMLEQVTPEEYKTQLLQEIMDLTKQICVLEEEVSEQCRLLGAGSEREARLMARVAELEKAQVQGGQS